MIMKAFFKFSYFARMPSYMRFMYVYLPTYSVLVLFAFPSFFLSCARVMKENWARLNEKKLLDSTQ